MSSKNQKKKRYRKRQEPIHTVTSAQKNMVIAMIGAGMEAQEIAERMLISRATLYRHYKDEIRRGRKFADSAVFAAAMKMATDGKHPGITTRWLEEAGIWEKANKLELTGANGTDLFEGASGRVKERLDEIAERNRNRILEQAEEVVANAPEEVE